MNIARLIAIAFLLLPAIALASAPKKRLACTAKAVAPPNESEQTWQRAMVAKLIYAARGFPELSVVPFEELAGGDPAGIAQTVAACGADLACVATRLREHNVDYGLDVTADFSSTPPLIAWTVLEASTARVLASDASEIDAVEIVEEIIAHSTTILARSGFVQGGRVVIIVDPADAALTFDPPFPSSGLERAFVLAPGKYRLTVSRSDFVTATRTIEVTSGSRERVELVLEKAESIFDSPWLYVASGAAVTIAAATLILIATTTEVPEAPLPGTNGTTIFTLEP